jgi:multimeric flavodoxin WrbA
MSSKREKRITVIHHSARGGTLAMVSAFCKGASEVDAVRLVTRSAEVCSRDDLLQSDVLVFSSPENFGYMAGSMKAMFDRLFYSMMSDTTDQGGGEASLLAGRSYLVLVCAGNDGSGAVGSIERIVAGWRMRKIDDAIIVRRAGGAAGSSHGSIQAFDLDRCQDAGRAAAEALALGIV